VGIRRSIVVTALVAFAGIPLAACGGPSATQQFQDSNSVLAASWSRYYLARIIHPDSPESLVKAA